MNWWRRLRYRECRICGAEFRKARPAYPSLVGFSYCSGVCESAAWDKWIKG